MSNTDRDSMLERWANGMEKLEQYYEDLYGPPGTPATLPSVTDRDGMLEAIADGLEEAQLNINKLSPVYHNKDVAYIKSVPAKVNPSATIEKLGGRTLVWNQLNNNNKGSETKNAVTFTKNGDGSWTIDGTASANGTKYFADNHYLINGHKYFVRGCPNIEGCSLGWAGTATDTGNGGIYTWSYSSGNYSFRFNFNSGVQFDNIKIYPWYCDLTLMFGEGNEPSIVAEFEAIFGADFYPYNAGELLSAGLTSVISKDSENTTIDTYAIPAEVQALTGYGWSCPNHYNYIDFEAKKFMQEVGSRAYAAGDESDSTVITDGVNTYYALTTPVETDISSYIDDNTIEVEANGTLEFPNGNGDDYKIPVPSTELFLVE